jgi:dephospho-CoA kinase
MTEAALDAIMSKQLPDEEKCARADFVVDTSQSKDHTRAQAVAILTQLQKNQIDA